MTNDRYEQFRIRVNAAFTPQGGGKIGYYTDWFIMSLIAANVVAVALETVDPLYARHATFFYWFEIVSVAIFSIEYLARIWACTVQKGYQHPVYGRVEFARRPMLIVDLLAILPFILTGGAYNSFIIRLLKLLRLLRVARVGRFSQAWVSLSDAIYGRRFELALSGAVAFLIMLISSAFLYALEGDTQPDAFGSIPRALWWSVATLTTVGYGDVTPVTVMGRIFAGLTAIAGIGLIAMPTGILAAAFSEAMQNRKKLAKDDARANGDP